VEVVVVVRRSECRRLADSNVTTAMLVVVVGVFLVVEFPLAVLFVMSWHIRPAWNIAPTENCAWPPGLTHSYPGRTGQRGRESVCVCVVLVSCLSLWLYRTRCGWRLSERRPATRPRCSSTCWYCSAIPLISSSTARWAPNSAPHCSPLSPDVELASTRLPQRASARQ